MASGLENIETIESPFRRFVTTIGVFPTAFTDAMTYYECLAYLVKYLEDTVILAVNENAEALEELQTLYIQLKKYVEDYFTNLDVQEEINNKLDAMVENGTLQEIITSYIQSNVAWTFDTVADMKASENLINGSYVQTLGFYTKGDGGASLYNIRNITNDDTVDESKIIEITGDTENNIIAEFIPKGAVNFEQYGAKGDGVNNDTIYLQNAINSGRVINAQQDKIYLINSDLSISADIYLTLNGSCIKSTNGSKLDIGDNVAIVEIKDGKFNNVYINDAGTGNVEASYTIKDIFMKDTEVHGIHLDNIDKAYISNCSFDNIGTGSITIHYQGCGIRINGANYADVSNSQFENCHGTGACVLRNTSVMYVSNCYFNNNDYRAIVPADDDNTFVTRGAIQNNTIKNCGVNASHNTGVGCNGIYSNNIGDITNLVVRGNHITNVCENGIEGKFGLVEYNYVDGTGVDMVNHPTPSASGINMYGNIYRYNVVKNSYLAGLYVSGVHNQSSTEISNKQIYGNVIGECTSTPETAIYVNGTVYTNIDVHDNTCDGDVTLAVAGKYISCRIGNNVNFKGMPYHNSFASYIEDKGYLQYAGFEISGTTISNITESGVTHVIDSDRSVTFTSEGTNKSITITANTNRNTLQCLTLFIADNNTELKVNVIGVKDDDTTTTLAWNRLIEKDGIIAGLTTQLDNTYKQVRYTIYVPDNATLKLKNIQVKEATI